MDVAPDGIIERRKITPCRLGNVAQNGPCRLENVVQDGHADVVEGERKLARRGDHKLRHLERRWRSGEEWV